MSIIRRLLYDKARKAKRIIWGKLGKSVFYNVNNEKNEKQCILIYKTAPFKNAVNNAMHQNVWQVRELARIIGCQGYEVDVIDYDDPYTRLNKNYDLVIGLIPRSIDVYSGHMNPGCRRIAYLTSSNLEYTNTKELKRIDELYERRGIRLKPRRQGGQIGKEIEEFDGAMFIGNSYNLKSYHCFKMPPVYFIKNNGIAVNFALTYEKKDSKNFLFFGSVGQVHKGLDLLLEIFSESKFPCNLYVCGRFKDEEDFCNAYDNELYHNANICPVGFVDVNDVLFSEIVCKCAYALMPSCAEASASAICTVMSAGVIPIVSKDCGYDEEDVINLEDCTKTTIRKYILEYSKKDSDWIKNESKRAIETVVNKYGKNNFSKSVEYALNTILKER